MAIGTQNNTLSTRIQLKSDTEANWNLVPDFIPLAGELIIYTSDSTHPYSRLKVGNGSTNIINLPFVDAGSLNGNEQIIYKFSNYNAFPTTGSLACLYLDISTGQLYHYDRTLGYQPIATVSLKATSHALQEIVQWAPGKAATANINNNILTLDNGVAPQLLTQNITVLTGVQIGGE